MSALGKFSGLAQEDLDKFENVYDEILQSLSHLNENSMRNMEVTTTWMEKVVRSNVVRGDSQRLLVTSVYKSLKDDLTRDQMKLAFVLDWCLEFFHGVNTIADNIMDNKEKTDISGSLTWHNVNNVGMMAVNDALMLKVLCFNAMKIFIGDQPFLYNQLADLQRDAFDKYILGRGLLEKFKREEDLQNFTLQRHRQIVDCTVGYNYFFIPVMFAITLTGKCIDATTEEYLKSILLDIGYLHQMEKDYNKYFGQTLDTNVGPCGLKWNWFFIKMAETFGNNDTSFHALLDCTKEKDLSEQRKILQESGMLKGFTAEKEQLSEEIKRKIANFQNITEDDRLKKFICLLGKSLTCNN